MIFCQPKNPILATFPAPVVQAVTAEVQEQQSPHPAPPRDDASGSASTPNSVSTTSTPAVGATTMSTPAAGAQQNIDESLTALTFHDTELFEPDQSVWNRRLRMAQ